MWPFLPKDQFAEVLVAGDENPTFSVCQCQHLIVVRPTRVIENGNNIVARESK